MQVDKINIHDKPCVYEKSGHIILNIYSGAKFQLRNFAPFWRNFMQNSLLDIRSINYFLLF